jgi:hypothetical protein
VTRSARHFSFTITQEKERYEEVRVLEGRGEVCFEEEVEQLWRSGKSKDEIAETMGVDPVWVEQLISQWSPEEASNERS